MHAPRKVGDLHRRGTPLPRILETIGYRLQLFAEKRSGPEDDTPP
jgi:hypothetical protein